MARISGVDLPRDKRVEIGLTYIYGIGRVSATKICAAAKVNPDTRCRDLTDEEVKKIVHLLFRLSAGEWRARLSLLNATTPEGEKRLGN